MNICVVGGAGYVGLITGLGFVRLGHVVTAIDLDRRKIKSLREGRSHIYEEGLQEALVLGLDTGRLLFVSEDWDKVQEADLVFVAVGTPAKNDGKPDLSQIQQVSERLAGMLDSYTVIVIKSTLSLEFFAGLDHMRTVLGRHHREGQDFDIVINPEFLREGQGLQDFFYPKRIVIGTKSERARAVMRELYAPFTGSNSGDGVDVPMATDVPMLETNPESALLIKYAANAFLATRISFINEVASICEHVGANVVDVAEGLGYDPRIGREYLEAGIGFGGPCLEKDLKAFIQFSQMSNYDPTLLQAVLDRNDQQIQDMVRRTKQILGGDLSNKKIAIFGLAFKAGTNDIRGSIPMRILEILMNEGAQVCSHDPVAIPQAMEMIPQATYCEDPYEAVQGADAILLVTEWPQYQHLSYDQIASKMRTPNLLDGRNILNAQEMKRLGFNYQSIGRLV